MEGHFLSSLTIEIEVSNIRRIAVQCLCDALMGTEFRTYVRSITSVEWSFDTVTLIRTARMTLDLTPQGGTQ